MACVQARENTEKFTSERKVPGQLTEKSGAGEANHKGSYYTMPNAQKRFRQAKETHCIFMSNSQSMLLLNVKF